MRASTLTMPVEPPFRLDLTVWVLRRRSKNIIDRWDGQLYRRALVLGNNPILVMAGQSTNNLSIQIKCARNLSIHQQAELKSRLRKMLGLDVNLEPFYKLVADEPALGRLARHFIGVRPPRFATLFETLVNAIACQQMSLDVGILLLNRLAQHFGKPIADGVTTFYAFPEPQDLIAVPEAALRQLGFSYQKARAIHSLAYSIVSGDTDLEQLETGSNSQALAALQSLRGIGRWSAEYALLRGLGRLDVFPGDDVGGQNNLQRLLQLNTRPSYEELGKLTAKWQPYAGLIYFHLLLNKLHEKGLV